MSNSDDSSVPSQFDTPLSSNNPSVNDSADSGGEAPTSEENYGAAIFFGSTVATFMALVGGILIGASGDTARFGVTMFIALPIAAGFVVSCFVRPLTAIMITTSLSLCLCFVALLFTGLEGIVCIIMASPLIFVGSIVGALIGWLARGWIDTRANFVLFPLIGGLSVFGIGQVENRLGGADRLEPVVSTVVLEANPQEVWRALVVMDNVSAQKPFLLQIGLPTPEHCTMEGEGNGATRTCHFNSGIIEETITDWEPPHRLDMKIVRSTLPGRHWLAFDSASYLIESVAPGKTQVTRTTTIKSKLRPACYWRSFEWLGVEAEHKYLFDSLSTLLKNHGT